MTLSVFHLREIRVVCCVAVCSVGSYLMMGHAEAVEPPAVSGVACQQLSGRYVYKGEALPGFPYYFRIMSLPLTMDVMLGIGPVVREVFAREVTVEILAEDGFQLIFLKEGKEIYRARLFDERKAWQCEDNTLTGRNVNVQAGAGEATRGTIQIIDTLSLDEEHALILTTIIKTTSRVLFWELTNPTETYAARFRRVR